MSKLPQLAVRLADAIDPSMDTPPRGRHVSTLGPTGGGPEVPEKGLPATDLKDQQFGVTIDLVRRLGNGARNGRELRCLMLQVLQAHFGETIPKAALEMIGFTKSAWTHGPYWKGLSPGALAAYDMNACAALHKIKGNVYVSLVPADSRGIKELAPERLLQLAKEASGTEK